MTTHTLTGSKRFSSLLVCLVACAAAGAQSTPAPATQNPPPITSQTPAKSTADPTAPTSEMSGKYVQQQMMKPRPKHKGAAKKRKAIEKQNQANPTT